jgi:uncharacterized protein (TIGR02452 family)
MKIHNEYLVKVYEDTLKESSKLLEHSNEIRAEKLKISDYKFGKFKSPEIKVINKDSISAALFIKKEDPNSKICMLNMASAKRPGGGVKRGARAQEEDLFRCTTLGVNVPDNLYPLGEDDFIYSKGVYVLKNSSYKKIEPFEVDVVSIPAINLNLGKRNNETGEYEDKIIPKPENYIVKMLSKINAMIESAADQNCNVLILGAWGCGVFKNDPIDVATMFHHVLVLQGHQNRFEKILFPIINDRNSVSDNYLVFKKILNP